MCQYKEINSSQDIIVSIAAISYKHAKYLRQAMDSIIEQKTNFRYEIVIGDDASNDGTAEILLEYQKKYPDIIRPIINEENMGGLRNYYNVLCHCKGKYITALETDDFWCDDKRLQKQVDYLEEHPEVSAVGSNYYMVNPEGEQPIAQLSEKQLNRVYSLKDFLNNNHIVHGNTMLMRNCFPVDDTRFKKLFFCVPTMGDNISKAILYDCGCIYTMPDIMHCHRSGVNDTTSFSFQQKANSIYYTKLMLKLVTELNEYFNNQYDFTPLVCNRLASCIVNKFAGTINFNMNEWVDIFKDLKIKHKVYIIKKTIFICMDIIIKKMLRFIKK